MRIAGNMLRFSQNPEDRSRIITATDRRDEIGTAERELAHMQSELSQLLAQKNRLAALGLAVSKINHDLRNLLANTQLLSDRLASSPDPTVQRFAPKLLASLDRAIAFCNDTLRFGRAAERAPRREMLELALLVEEVGDGLGLPREGIIDWRSTVDPKLEIDADREHLFRVLTNLVRNAVQALEAQGPAAKGVVAVEAEREGAATVIRVADDGPGVPPKAREHLFQAFQGSARKGGTGLGLAIAQELIVAHGGTIRLLDRPRGATFEISIPDRQQG
jgi:signal transduction histidine kinase